MLTVTAKDSSTAMDEIVSKLGSDAMIISTRRVETGIEITATSDILDLKSRLNKREMDPVSFKSNRTLINKGEAGNIESVKETSLNTNDENFKTAFLNDIKMLLDKYQSQLTPTFNEMTFLSDVLVKQDGHTRFNNRFSNNQYNREKFIEIFSREIVDIDHSELLNSSIIYIVGPSGSGKSTFAAKLVYTLKEKFSDTEFFLLEANRNNFVEQSILSFCAKITGLCYRDKLEEITNDHRNKVVELDQDTYLTLKETNDHRIKVVELDLDTYLTLKETKKLNADAKTFLTIPAGSSCSLIASILKKLKTVKPRVVFTKLDESDVNFDEVVEIFNFDCKLSFLSANAKLSEGLCFATNEIMSWFLNDRLAEGTNKWQPQ